MEQHQDLHPVFQPVIIEFADLLNGKDLKNQIQLAYGPKGHGILFVRGIPNYAEARMAALPLIHRLASLPQDKLAKYKRPEIYFSRGWSHGVQKFQGKYDTSKASYYLNAVTDEPYTPTSQTQNHFTPIEKQLFSSNRWVEDIPQIQTNVKALSKIMIDTGILLARHIDAYAHSKVSTYPENKLYRIIEEGKSHIGRLLHYFPFEEKGSAEDDWCGWHNDHGSLTALTSALHTDEKGETIKFPVKTGGLYARNRFADKVRIGIPEDMLAFQLGESTQIHTGGFLEATPHCVVRSEELAGQNISRNTYAIFMQPDPLEVMDTPEGLKAEAVNEQVGYKVAPIKARWDNGIFFKEFHSRTLKFYS